MSVMDYKWTMIERVFTACYTVYDVCKPIFPIINDFKEEKAHLIINVIKLMVETDLDASSHIASNTSINEQYLEYTVNVTVKIYYTQYFPSK